MFWVIVCTVLAAAGLFAAGWALFGWCVLPQRREAVTVYRLQACEPQLERQVRAFVWARESGLAAGRLMLAGGEETPETRLWPGSWRRPTRASSMCPAANVTEAPDKRSESFQESMEWNRNRR